MTDTKSRIRPSPVARPSPRPRDREPADTAAAPSGTPQSSDGGHGRRRARASLLATLLACFLLLAAATVWFAIEVDALGADGADENVALVDSEATQAVADEVSDGLKAVFSYNYTSPDRTRRAADRVLLDRAQQQYRDRFAAAAEQAAEDELVRTATVREIGVRAIRGDTARLLVFLDQQSVTEPERSSRQQTVSLRITAKRMDGSWKIAKFGGD